MLVPIALKERADDDLREAAWAPSVETAPIHPELMAQSYRNVRRVQQLQDTAQIAYENESNRSKRRAEQGSKQRSKQLSNVSSEDVSAS